MGKPQCYGVHWDGIDGSVCLECQIKDDCFTKFSAGKKKDDDTQPTTAFVLPRWQGLPMPGDEVEVVRPERKRRGEVWRVVETKTLKNPDTGREMDGMFLVPVRNVKRL